MVESSSSCIVKATDAATTVESLKATDVATGELSLRVWSWVTSLSWSTGHANPIDHMITENPLKCISYNKAGKGIMWSKATIHQHGVDKTGRLIWVKYR
jgi:hypothetical protein